MRHLNWRFVLTATIVAVIATSVLMNLVARYMAGSMAVSWLLPWVQNGVALSLFATLLLLTGSVNGTGESERASALALLVCLAMTVAVAVFLGGAAGTAKTLNAVKIAFTSQEVFGLGPAMLAGAIIASKVVGGAFPTRGLWESIMLLFLPGPLLPLLSLVSPGNERFLATLLLPCALAAAAILLWVGRRRRDGLATPANAAALLGSVILFYGPIMRGVANSGETALLSFSGLALFASVHGTPGAQRQVDLVADLREVGLLVLALATGIELHRVVGLQLLVDRGALPILVPAVGVALVTTWLFACRRAKPRVATVCALAVPLVVAPLLDCAFNAPAQFRIAGIRQSVHADSISRGSSVPADRWIELESLGSTPRRRMHSDTVFDAKRNQLVMVGSDGHGWDWDMAVYRFDVATREWQRSGTAEPRYTYRSDRQGQRVAGSAIPGPWAMHAYDQAVIDPRLDSLWLVSAPLHNHVPIIGAVKDAPWIFDLESSRWHPQSYQGTPPMFFSGVAVYDSLRDTLLASAALAEPTASLGLGEESTVRRGGVWELGPDRQRWQPVGGTSPHGPVISGVFDDSAKSFLIFERRGAFWVHRYIPGTLPGTNGQWLSRALPDGPCAHSVQYPAVPAAYVAQSKTVLLSQGADGKRRTCMYDAAANSATDLGIDPPPDLPMDFDITYDPLEGVLFVITGEPFTGKKARVWALRFHPVRITRN